MLHRAENNPEEISIQQSNTALPPDFSTNNHYLPKCTFTVLSALLCSSGCCPMIPDYSLLGQGNYSYVMDGGALLHCVCLVKGSNFKKIAKSYVQYVRKHYGKCYIFFDGYKFASKKSVEQKQRGKHFQKCPDVDVKEDIIVLFTQDNFLSNTNTKVQLIKMLSQYLKYDGNEVINCSDDADSTICHTALDLATT